MGYNKLVPRVLGGGSCVTFTKELGFFYRSLLNLETYHRLESIQKSSVGAYCYLRGFLSYGGGR